MADMPVQQMSNQSMAAPVPPRDDDQPMDDVERPMDDMDAAAEDAGAATAMSPEEEKNRQLLASDECARLDNEWQAIQATFVDSPRASVEKADALVSKTIDTISASFADMRNSLERTWEKDREVSTEDLRLALQNYRSFFRRLLSV